jgi:hypothetical protein
MRLLLKIGFMVFAAMQAYAQVKVPVQVRNVPAGFDLDAAMSLLGSYKPNTHSLIYKIPSLDDIDPSARTFFEQENLAIVRPFWVSSVVDGGIHKIVVLTHAVPGKSGSEGEAKIDETFDCHGCIPLIGAAFFVQTENGWKVESSRLLIASMGEFARPPTEIIPIRIGPNRIGIEITDHDIGQGEMVTDRRLLVAWNSDVRMAFHSNVADSDRGSCGSREAILPCYANRKTMMWVPGADREFYDLIVTLTGTDIADDDPQKVIPVHGRERLQFLDGRYRTVKRTGATTSLEKAIAQAR